MGRQPGSPLWSFSYPSLVQKFKAACETVPLPFKIVPYQLRHSGPSIDRSRDCRTQAEVQKRGRWRTAKSLTRYEKHARMADLFLEMPARAQSKCLGAEARIGDIVLQGLVEAHGRILD